MRTLRPIVSEKVTDRQLKAAVEKAGGFYIKLETKFTAGLPDRLVLLPGGKTFFCELKTTGKKAEKLQSFIHEKLINKGFDVFVVDSCNITEVLKLVK